jgi:hypothetical protein
MAVGSRPGPTISTATVTNTDSTVLAQNGQRVYASISNDGDVDAYVNLGAAAEAGKGWYLQVGGTIEITVDDYRGRDIWATDAVHAITASGSTTLSIAEVAR